MGSKINLKLGALIGILLITVFFSYLSTKPRAVIQKAEMGSFFNHIQGYKFHDQAHLPDNAAQMLNLDDYIYMDFDGPQGRVNLYIGYYFTSGKAYAAHSPLICYPSQGWKIERQAEKHNLNVGSNNIQYEEIITSYGEQKELVLYWYQADQFTTTNVYLNKVYVGYNKITKDNEQFAFIRVSTPIDTTYQDARSSALDFISALYPKLSDYFKDS